MSLYRPAIRHRPRRDPRPPVGGTRALLGLLVATVCAPIPAGGQELPLRTGYPGSPDEPCPDWSPPAPPSASDSAQIRSLVTSTSHAVVLGDAERVRKLVERALELDPGSPELNYRHARALEEVGELEQSRSALCRVMAVDHETARREDARARWESLGRTLRRHLSNEAVAAFQAGTRAARAGRDAEAASHFAVAANAARDWPAAQYNHGVLLSLAGRRREAAERLRRYLTLRPDARDAVAVAERIGQLESTGRPSGPSVLALGLVVPGLDQFYSGRPRMGALVLGLTAGVVASGLLTREVRVRCIDSVEEGRCPSAQIVTREVERPWLDRALAGAAVVAVAGAIEAYFAASASDADEPLFEDAGPEARSDGPRLGRPKVSGGPYGLDVSLLTVRFE